jgi:hypothetical protein
MYNRSTTSATLLLHSLLDSDKTLYINSWDFKGAFDAISNPLIDISYERLGFPSNVANWIHSFDRAGTTIVRSPHAQHLWSPTSYLPDLVASFTPGKGVGQGDVHSAHTWKICIDVLLRSFDSLKELAGLSGVDMAYADDVVTVSEEYSHAQLAADLVSLFSNLARLPLSVDKLRAFIRSRLRQHQQHIVVSSANWVERSVPLVLNGTLKYLGCLHDLNPSSRHSLLNSQFQRSRLQLTNSVDMLLTKRRLHFTPAILRSYLAKTVPQIVYG